MAGSRRRALGLLAAIVLVASSSGLAAQQRRSLATAEIRIGLPASSPPVVSVAPEADSIVVDLPRGATFPDDFVRSSGGLLLGGVAEESGDRVELRLELAGLLDRVIYGPDALILRLKSRYFAPQAVVDVDEQYLIGADDVLQFKVYNHEDLTTELAVSRDGLITAPLIGEVRAAGLSPRQLAARIAERMGNCCIVDPQVDLTVAEYRSQWIVVDGAVRRPGRVTLRGGTRLTEVLGQSEGFTDRAGEEITITRRAQGGGTPKVLRVNREDFESGKLNPVLTHGDIVEVGVASYCYIQGEVVESNRVRVERGMTLMRVIAMAGGLTEWANRKNVTVIYDDGRVPRERVYNLNRIEKGKTPDPIIEGGEKVFVKRRFL